MRASPSSQSKGNRQDGELDRGLRPLFIWPTDHQRTSLLCGLGLGSPPEDGNCTCSLEEIKSFASNTLCVKEVQRLLSGAPGFAFFSNLMRVSPKSVRLLCHPCRMGNKEVHICQSW